MRERKVKGSTCRSGWGTLVIEGASFQLRPISDSPCRVGCPAGVNVKAYVGLIAAGKFDQALAVVRAQNPFPGICGRICTHPCESECRRGEIDEPVAIRALKRFIADYMMDNALPITHHAGAKREAPGRERIKRVAVVGAGPAGLTAANDLAGLGYQVTLFEAQSRPGGMLVWGIPPFRLPRAVIEQEINSILGLGVNLITNVKVTEPQQLLKEGFSAVFYAPGHQKSIPLGLPLEDQVIGVIDSLTFLKKAYTGELKRLTDRVLVIGGGDSAIDSARVAIRLGAEEVWIVYRRTKKEMPAAVEEVVAAEQEGIRIEYLTQPVAFEHKNGRLTGLRCVRTKLGPKDESGRRRPVPIAGSEFTIAANLVITALGQKPEVEIGEIPQGVFIGGDAEGGPATVVDAIASGHRGAKRIHQFITGEEIPSLSSNPEIEFLPPVLTALPVARVRPRVLPITARRSFDEVEAVLTPAEAMAEAGRCLRCGPCGECVLCHNTCPKHQVLLKAEEGWESRFIRVHSWEKVFPNLPDKVNGSLLLSRKKSVKVTLIPLVVTVDSELCRGCGRCVDNCPHQAIALKEWQKGIAVVAVDLERCRGCGNCLTFCPSGALRFPGANYQ